MDMRPINKFRRGKINRVNGAGSTSRVKVRLGINETRLRQSKSADMGLFAQGVPLFSFHPSIMEPDRASHDPKMAQLDSPIG